MHVFGMRHAVGGRIDSIAVGGELKNKIAANAKCLFNDLAFTF